MKSVMNFLAACCLVLTHAYAGGIVKLHGKITNPISDSISVVYQDSWVGYEPRTVSARLGSDGSFSLSFPQKHDYSVVSIRHGAQGTEIAPLPGDDLLLTLNAANFDSTLHYEGKGAEIANFMAAHMLARSFANFFGSRTQGASGLAPDSFIVRINTSLQKETDFVNNNGAALPESFKKLWLANFQYGVYDAMLNYPVFHEVQKQHSYSISQFDVTDFPVVQTVPGVFDDNLLDLPYYRQYVTKYYNEQLGASERLKGLKPGNNDSAALRLTIANMPPRSAELYEASLIYRHVNTGTYSDLISLLSTFRDRCPNSEYLALLGNKIEAKKKTSAGSPEMDFAINTIDGKTMRLSDLKGKVVFIDFWASWCGPCKGEMPYAKKIEEQFKGKDVVFLYVSLDADPEAWKKMLDEMQVDGIHMRDGSGGWTGPVATEYGIQSVPSFFLIDKQGVYAMDATPRPSQTNELVAAIDKLLK